MAESAKRVFSLDQWGDEFTYLEKAFVRYRLSIIAYLLFICLFKFIIGNKNHLLYLTIGLYISYLIIIELINYSKDSSESNIYRAFRVEMNIIFTSILLYLGSATFEFYLLFIPWIIASTISFSKIWSLLITIQIAVINSVTSLLIFEQPLENVQFSSSITRVLLLFLIWWSSQWWLGKRILSQERKIRLQILHELQMEAMDLQNINELFKKVVELTYYQLNSEESALFLQDTNEPSFIVKVALKASSTEIEHQLLKEEKSYTIGESLTGSVFKNRQSIITFNMEEDDRVKRESVARYRKIIPSGRILHYIGVPLVVEDEVLGVLRVINRKGSKYSLDKKNFQLSKNGFDEEDRILLEIIAREVAIAIKNAKTKDYLDHLVDNTDEAVIALNQKGIIQKINKSAERILVCNAKDVIGTSVIDIYKDEREAHRIMKFLRKAEDGRVSNLEAAVKNTKGEIIPIDLSACLLYNETGEWLGSLGLFRDLRKLKDLQDRVIQSERMVAMGTIARSVGHELKQDFSSIILYAEALLKFLTNNKMGYKTAQKIIRISDEGVEKLAKMLKAVRPQPPEKKRWSVKELFDGITDEFREKSRLKGITFNVKYINNLPKIEVDSKQIKEVLYNLFNNSLDSTKEGEEINLSIQQKEDKLLICWENTGENIPEQDIPELFDPFFTRKKNGSGLGLSIVRMIIINHRGRIWVDPQVQKGARFYIELPISGDLA